jgi:hypothetical protein
VVEIHDCLTGGKLRESRALATVAPANFAICFSAAGPRRRVTDLLGIGGSAAHRIRDRLAVRTVNLRPFGLGMANPLREAAARFGFLAADFLVRIACAHLLFRLGFLRMDGSGGRGGDQSYGQGEFHCAILFMIRARVAVLLTKLEGEAASAGCFSDGTDPVRTNSARFASGLFEKSRVHHAGRGRNENDGR